MFGELDAKEPVAGKTACGWRILRDRRHHGAPEPWLAGAVTLVADLFAVPQALDIF